MIPVKEFDYHELFKKWCEKTGRYKVIERSHDSHNIPDAWVEADGVQMPVEVKKNNFDAKALEQLQRYMRVYHCENGVAVAKKCTIDLPESIDFVSFDEFDTSGIVCSEARQKEIALSETCLNSLYSNIEAERARRGWTMMNAAEKLGISEVTYRKRIANSVDIKISDLFDIAKLFDVSIDYLLGMTDKTNVFRVAYSAERS